MDELQRRALKYYESNPLDIGGCAEHVGLTLSQFRRQVYEPLRQDFLDIEAAVKGLLQSLCAKAALGQVLPAQHEGFKLEHGIKVLKLLETHSKEIKREGPEGGGELDAETEKRLADRIEQEARGRRTDDGDGERETGRLVLLDTTNGGDNETPDEGGARRGGEGVRLGRDSSALLSDTDVQDRIANSMGIADSSGDAGGRSYYGDDTDE